MAGEWIKFELTTPDKPEVVAMAATLGIDQDAVVGKLLRLWVWADQNSISGNGVSVTSAFLDRLTFCNGFALAMRQAGWLTGEDGSLNLPNFDRHNGKTSKERAVTNRRVTEHRKQNGKSNADSVTGVTPAPLQKPLPEKRREEEEQEQNPQPPLQGVPSGDEPKTKRKRSEAITLKTFLATIEAGREEPFPNDDPVWQSAADMGLPREFVVLQWWWFQGRYLDTQQKQSGVNGWRQKFRTAVREGWGRLWWTQEGQGYQLTTVGVQTKREMEAAAREAA